MQTVFSIYQNLEKYNSTIIQVQGWVKSIRESKEITFVSLNDGSTIENLQIVFNLQKFSQSEKLSQLNFGNGLVVKGKLVLTPQRKQLCELEVQEIIFSNQTDSDYPLQKKSLPLEVVRNHPHLRTKTNYFLAMFRLRSSLTFAIHQFFQQEEFHLVTTSIITSNDTEGVGELFTLITDDDKSKNEGFFGKSAKLTVSGQLQAESLAQGLGKVYTFNPCFRAEKSHTTRHLAEFWMLEPEISFANLNDILELSEKLIKYIINYAITNNYRELEYFEKYGKKEIISKIKKITNESFQKIDYTEAVKILEKNKDKFICNKIYWGMDLQSEHEKYLCQYFDKPVFVTNYPKELKAFYMKNNADGKTVACMDLLVPEIGELIGGSAREDNYSSLKEKAKLNEDLNWYYDLRRYGYAPSAGFGLGFERLLMFLIGTENIRDTIPFPRYSKHLEF